MTLSAEHFQHEQFMRRAIALAMQGRGTAEPNPMVGCVLVRDGRVIGEGFHYRSGGPHAEPTALAACTETSRGATAYVTLEPCCHTNKRTPPCVPALLTAGIARVVLGAIDPNPAVNGQGIAQLRAAGVEVVEGVLTAECNQLLAPFIAATRFQRPYITLKFAQTADGVMASQDGRLMISGPAAQAIVQDLRGRCDAILVGGRTAVVDDPQLTVRGVAGAGGGRTPLRCVLTHQSNLPTDSRLMTGGPPVIVYSSGTLDGITSPPHVTLVQIPDSRLEQVFPKVLSDLHARGVTHLLVEPGPVLLRGLLKIGLWDRLWCLTSDRKSPTAVQGQPQAQAVQPASWVTPGTLNPPCLTQSFKTADDTIEEFLNPASQVFFAAVPSADALSCMNVG